MSLNALPERMPGTPTRGESGCQAPPLNAVRFPTRFPRGATFDIVCLEDPADLEEGGSDNVKNGTSTARGPTHPDCEDVHIWGRVVGNSKFKIENSKLLWGGWAGQ